MAIDLGEGEYALQQTTSKKTLLQLKLTDSALKAIEAYQDLREAHGKPNIQFSGNQGTICIPSRDSLEPQSFTFQLSTLNAETDCIEQFQTSGSFGQMSVLGSIQQKITINANDESYNATRKRMTLVKQQEQKTSTKVIKQPNSKLGKKKQLGRSMLDARHHRLNQNTPPPPASSTPSFTHSSPLTIGSSHSVSPVTTHSSSTGDQAGVRNKTKPTIFSPATNQPNPPVAGSSTKTLQDKVVHYLILRPHKYQDLISRLQGTTSGLEPKLQSVLKQVSSLEAARGGGSLREYVLHKHLYNEVRADWPGYTDDERAVVRRKLAEATFRKRALATTTPSPPAAAAGKMTSSNKTPSGGGKTTSSSSAAKPTSATSKPHESGVSPSSSTSSKLLPTAVHDDSYTNPVKKKQRVSLFKKSSPPPPPSGATPRSESPLEAPLAPPPGAISSSSVVSLDFAVSAPAPNKQQPQRVSPFKPKTAPAPRSVSPYKPPAPHVATPTHAQCDATENGNHHHHVKPPPPPPPRFVDSPAPVVAKRKSPEPPVAVKNPRPPKRSRVSNEAKSAEKDDFMAKYKSINYDEQRVQYKSDFYAEYDEYLSLHEKVVAESRRFAKYQAQIRELQEGSETYKSIARQVIEDYNLLRKDEAYMKSRRRFEYLHRKLKFIKDQVVDYDCRQYSEHGTTNVSPLGDMMQGGECKTSPPAPDNNKDSRHSSPCDAIQKRQAMLTA